MLYHSKRYNLGFNVLSEDKDKFTNKEYFCVWPEVRDWTTNPVAWAAEQQASNCQSHLSTNAHMEDINPINKP